MTLANGVLTIKGEKKQEREEKKENYFLAERSFGSFERSLSLPDTIDAAAARRRRLKVSGPAAPRRVRRRRPGRSDVGSRARPVRDQR